MKLLSDCNYDPVIVTRTATSVADPRNGCLAVQAVVSGLAGNLFSLYDGASCPLPGTPDVWPQAFKQWTLDWKDFAFIMVSPSGYPTFCKAFHVSRTG